MSIPTVPTLKRLFLPFGLVILIFCSPDSSNPDMDPLSGAWLSENGSGDDMLIIEKNRFTRKMTGDIAHSSRADTLISTGSWIAVKQDSLKIVYDGTTDTFTVYCHIYSNGTWNEDELEVFNKIYKRQIAK